MLMKNFISNIWILVYSIWTKSYVRGVHFTLHPTSRVSSNTFLCIICTKCMQLTHNIDCCLFADQNLSGKICFLVRIGHVIAESRRIRCEICCRQSATWAGSSPMFVILLLLKHHSAIVPCLSVTFPWGL
jgi:hypothetical protein